MTPTTPRYRHDLSTDEVLHSRASGELLLQAQSGMRACPVAALIAVDA